MIEKFRTIQEAEKNTWTLDPKDEYYKKMNEFFIMIEKLSSFKVKRGVYKFANINAKRRSAKAETGRESEK